MDTDGILRPRRMWTGLAPVYETTVSVIAKKLNMRSGAGTGNQVLEVLHEGDVLRVLDNLDNGWIKVEYSNLNGYVSNKYVGKEKIVDVSPVVFAGSGPRPTVSNP